jgi:hypothetical protein
MQGFLAGVAAALCVVGALIAGYVLGGGSFGSGEEGTLPPPVTEPQVRATVLGIRPTPTQAPAAAPGAPTPTPAQASSATPPDSTSTPQSADGVTTQPTQAAESAEPVQDRFTWGGAGGEYIAFSTTLCESGTVGYTVSGEYTGRSFCTQERVQGMPPFTCPEGAHAEVQQATAQGAPIGEVFCVIPYTPTPVP